MDLLSIAGDIGEIKLGAKEVTEQGIKYTLDTPQNTKQITINMPNDSSRLKETNRLLVIEQEKNQELDENIKSLNEAVSSWKELCISTEQEVKSVAQKANANSNEWSELQNELRLEMRTKDENFAYVVSGLKKDITKLTEELQEERELGDHKTVEICELKENNKELKKLLSRINKLVI